jgi:hypothetical protein
MSGSGSLTIEQMIAEVDKIKERWLKKEILFINLTKELEDVTGTFKKASNYVRLKDYFENVILLDKNVESSETVILNVTLALIPLVLSVINSVVAFTGNRLLTIWSVISSIGLSAGFLVIAISRLKKHAGTYAREKSFYEILIKIL